MKAEQSRPLAQCLLHTGDPAAAAAPCPASPAPLTPPGPAGINSELLDCVLLPCGEQARQRYNSRLAERVIGIIAASCLPSEWPPEGGGGV